MGLFDYERLRARFLTLFGALGGRLGHRFSNLAVLAPDLFVLGKRVLGDERVPPRTRAELGAALLYLLSPFDLVPETLFGPAGLIDDAAVLTRALDTLLNRVPEEVLREHWPGAPHQLETLRARAKNARKLFSLGARTGLRALWNRHRHALRRRLRLTTRFERSRKPLPAAAKPAEQRRKGGLRN